jgi:tubulin-specific chaperone A
MPAPSQLSIATSSVRRLLKEEASYHKELAAEEKKLQELEAQAASGTSNDDDGNAEFLLKQHVSSFLPLFTLVHLKM